MKFSISDRNALIQNLQTEEYDLAIIGGGISGAGVARDAASRGMKVALIEASDFASGTSSRSSKLIHGGIRYLENYEFGLVFEALSERSHLFDIAPHLVHPLRFMLPVYKDSRVGMFLLGAGMWLYDALSLFQAPQMHERLNAEQTMNRMPSLDSKNLCGSYVYSDAYMDDDRLVIESLRSAHNFGAHCISYVECTGVEKSGGCISALKAKDKVSGKEFQIKAKNFIGTVGPWTDIVGEGLFQSWKKKMRPSKGVHLTFSRERINLDSAVVMISDDEKRIVFGIPRHEMVIIGTTDTDFKSNPAEVKTDAEDVKYLLHIANTYFPGAQLTENDIIASYSGIRPLVDDGSATESKTSREHEIFDVAPNFCFLSGGKYTTYRKMAEQTVEHVLRRLDANTQMKFQQSKSFEALNPLADTGHLEKARRSINDLCRKYALDKETVESLVERHGMEVPDLLQMYRWKLKGVKNILWALEAHHAIDETMCFHLLDFYLRRTPLFLSRADHGKPFLLDVADVFAEKLGWDEAKKAAEIESIEAHIQHEMGWQSRLRSRT